MDRVVKKGKDEEMEFSTEPIPFEKYPLKRASDEIRERLSKRLTCVDLLEYNMDILAVNMSHHSGGGTYEENVWF